MTLPMDPGRALGESEFSHGGGQFPHPDSNFQSGKLPFPEPTELDDNYQRLVAYKRLDSTVADETERDMLFAKGNPDRFGDQQPLVTEPVNNSQRNVEEPDISSRVRRDG